MSTTTLRIDEPLRQRILKLAGALDQTPHSFMLEALAQKTDEAEWKLALQLEADRRDKAMQKAGNGIEWNDLRQRLNAKLAQRAQTIPSGLTQAAKLIP